MGHLTMTTGNNRKDACEAKGKHTKAEAKARAAALQRISGAFMNAYHCRYCRGWHVGHRKHYGRRR